MRKLCFRITTKSTRDTPRTKGPHRCFCQAPGRATARRRTRVGGRVWHRATEQLSGHVVEEEGLRWRHVPQFVAIGQRLCRSATDPQRCLCSNEPVSTAVSRGVFDVVISNGVLHHTGDCDRGFRSILSKLKPSGYIFIGLYNSYARLPTLWKSRVFRALGSKLQHRTDSTPGALCGRPVASRQPCRLLSSISVQEFVPGMLAKIGRHGFWVANT
jgi:SAM-dependent methyltransferase